MRATKYYIICSSHLYMAKTRCYCNWELTLMGENIDYYDLNWIVQLGVKIVDETDNLLWMNALCSIMLWWVHFEGSPYVFWVHPTFMCSCIPWQKVKQMHMDAETKQTETLSKYQRYSSFFTCENGLYSYSVVLWKTNNNSNKLTYLYYKLPYSCLDQFEQVTKIMTNFVFPSQSFILFRILWYNYVWSGTPRSSIPLPDFPHIIAVV